MPEPPDREARLPLAEEHVAVHKRTVEKGRVRIRTVVDESTRWVTDSLTSEHVQVARVPIGREVEAVPPIRQEGDTTIIPVVDEVLVIDRRLILREELHVTKEQRVEQVAEPVTVRTMRAEVEREMRPSGTGSTDTENRGEHDVTNTDGAI